MQLFPMQIERYFAIFLRRVSQSIKRSSSRCAQMASNKDQPRLAIIRNGKLARFHQAADTPSCTLFARHSLDQYLWAALLAAGAELGAIPAASSNQH